MSDILLDYVFRVNINIPIPAADITYIRTPLVICKPSMAGTPGYYTVNTAAEVAAQTDNTSCLNLFGINNGKLSSFKLLTTTTLDIQTLVDLHIDEFFTILISDDFTIEDFFDSGSASDSGDDSLFGELNVGVNFSGVIGFSIQKNVDPVVDADNIEWLRTWSITHTGFYGHPKNMFESFGKLLGSTIWQNQQYETMPETGVDFNQGLGKAENLFTKRISFVITSAQYGNKLSFFAHGGQAIVAPYVIQEIKTLLQGTALTWIQANQPNYTITQATLLQEELEKVFAPYIARDIIESGTVQIVLEADNFVAQGTINVSEPKALWKVVNELFEI